MESFESLLVKEALGQSPRTVKNVNEIDHILDNEDQLLRLLQENKEGLNNEQLNYLRYLVTLETSVFKEEDLNKQLIGTSTFYEISKYNLYERTLKLYKNQTGIDKKHIVFNYATRFKNNLIIRYINKYNVVDLLEASFDKSRMDIDIYDSAGYNDETKIRLREYYQNLPDIVYSPETIESKLRLVKEKREVTHNSAELLLNDWALSGFEVDEMDSYIGSKRKVKTLSWVFVSKYDIDK